MQKQSRQNTQTAFYSPQHGICSPQPLRQIISPGIQGPRNSQNFLIDSYTTKHQDLDSDRLLGSSLRFNMLKDSHQQIEKEISVLKSNLLQSRMSGDNYQFSQQPLDKLLKRMDDKGTRKTEQIRADDLLTEILQELSFVSINAKKLQNQRSSQKLQMQVIKDIREIITGWNDMHNIINQICQAAQISVHQLYNTNIAQLLKKDEINKLYSLVEKHQNIYPQSFDQLFQIIANSFQSREQDQNKFIEINTQLRQYEMQNKDLNIKNKNLFAVITKLEAKVNKLQNKTQQLELSNKQFSNQLQNSCRTQDIYTDNEKFKQKNPLIESQSSLDSKNNQNKFLEMQLNKLQEDLVEKDTEIMNLRQQIDEYNENNQINQKKTKQLENENKILKLQLSKLIENEKQLQKQKIETTSEYQNYKVDSSQKLKTLTQEIVDLKQKQNKSSTQDHNSEIEKLNYQISNLKVEMEDKEREYGLNQSKLQDIKQKYNELKQSYQELSDQYQRDQLMNKQIVQSLQIQKEDFDNRNQEQEIETQQQLIKQLESDLQQAQSAFKQQELKSLNQEDEINSLKIQIKKLEQEHTEQLHILDNTIQSKDQIIQQYESNSRILNDTPEQLRSKSVEQTTIQGHLKSQIDSLNKSLSHYEQQIRDLTKVNNEQQDQINNKDRMIRNKNQEIIQLQQQIKELQVLNQKIQVQERTIHQHEKQVTTFNQSIQKLQESLNFKDQIIQGKQHEIEMLQNQKKDHIQQLKQQTLLYEQQSQKAKVEHQDLQNKIKKFEEQLSAKSNEQIIQIEQQGIQKNQIQQLEQQQRKLKQDYEDEKKQLSEKISKLMQEQEEAEKILIQLNQKQIELENTQNKVYVLESELISAQDQIQQLESKNKDLQSEIKLERQNFLLENQLKIEEIASQLKENEELIILNQDLTQKNIALKDEIEKVQLDQSNNQSRFHQEIETIKAKENHSILIIKQNEITIQELTSQIEQFKQSQNEFNQEKIKLSQMLNEQLDIITELNKQLAIKNIINEQQLEETKAQYSSELVIKEAELIQSVMKQSLETQKLLNQISALIDQLEKNKLNIQKLETKLADSEQKYQILIEKSQSQESQSQQLIQSQVEGFRQLNQQQELTISNLKHELNEKSLELQTQVLHNEIQKQDANNQKQQIDNLTQQLKQQQSLNQDLNEKIQNLLREAQNDQQQFNNLQNTIIQLEQNNLQQKSQINELTQLLNFEQEKCSQQKDESIERSKQIDQQLNEIKQMKKVNNHLKDLQLNLEKYLEAKEVIIANNIDIINDQDLSIKKINQELIEKENKLQNCLKEFEKQNNKFYQLKSQNTILENQIQEKIQIAQTLQQELNIQRHSNQELEQSNKNLQLQINQDAQIQNQLTQKNKELQERINILNNEILELNKKNKELVENQVQITNKIDADQASNKLIASQQEQIIKLEQKIIQLENDLKTKEDQIIHSLQESQAQEKKLLQQSTQLANNQEELIAQQKIDNDNLKNQNNQLSLYANSLQQDLKNLELELQQEVIFKQQINDNNSTLDNNLRIFKEKLYQSEQQNQKLAKQIQEVEDQLLIEKQRLNSQIENLISQISAQQKQSDEQIEALIQKNQDIVEYSKRESEAMKMITQKDGEILRLQNEIEVLKNNGKIDLMKNNNGQREDQINKQLEEKNEEIKLLKNQLELCQQKDIDDILRAQYQNKENEIKKLIAQKDNEISTLNNELDAKMVQMNKVQTAQIQNQEILNKIKELFNQENILDYLRQFKSQHEKQCEKKLIYFQCLQSLIDEYLRNQSAAFYAQNYLKLTQQEQNSLLAYQKDIQLMKAKLPNKTALYNIVEDKNEDLSFNSLENQLENMDIDKSGFIEGLDMSAILNNDKNKKENSTSNKKQLSHTEEVNILKSKLEAANEENVKIVAKFQILLERIAAKEEQMLQLNNLARDYKHKMMAMQKTSVDPQAVHAKAHLRDCLKKFLTACGPKTQKFDLAEAILITLFQFLEFSEKEKEDILDELAVKPADKKKGIVQILFKK